MANEVLAEEGPDAAVAWHFGDPLREQRGIEAGRGVVDLSHRGVLTVSGPDRLSWLHSLTSQALDPLAPGVGVTTLILSPQGHVEHALYGVDDGETFWAHTEPGRVGAVVAFLDRMRFMLRVEVADRTEAYGVVWHAGRNRSTDLLVRSGEDSLGGFEVVVPRNRLAAHLDVPDRAGTWAYEAVRIAAGVPRFGLDTDERTIPNEVGVLGSAVHLDKGCYRGQETVARVHNLGRPPRRLVLLHLDGSVETLPATGDPVTSDGRQVGFVTTAVRHYELGTVALALVKRNTADDAELHVGDVAAAIDA
ncbi:MAG: YgfZ/GcvT domain-containing protein [Propionibacteriaceae bacterium]